MFGARGVARFRNSRRLHHTSRWSPQALPSTTFLHTALLAHPVPDSHGDRACWPTKPSRPANLCALDRRNPGPPTECTRFARRRARGCPTPPSENTRRGAARRAPATTSMGERPPDPPPSTRLGATWGSPHRCRRARWVRLALGCRRCPTRPSRRRGGRANAALPEGVGAAAARMGREEASLLRPASMRASAHGSIASMCCRCGAPVAANCPCAWPTSPSGVPHLPMDVSSLHPPPTSSSEKMSTWGP